MPRLVNRSGNRDRNTGRTSFASLTLSGVKFGGSGRIVSHQAVSRVLSGGLAAGNRLRAVILQHVFHVANRGQTVNRASVALCY